MSVREFDNLYTYCCHNHLFTHGKPFVKSYKEREREKSEERCIVQRLCNHFYDCKAYLKKKSSVIVYLSNRLCSLSPFKVPKKRYGIKENYLSKFRANAMWSKESVFRVYWSDCARISLTFNLVCFWYEKKITQTSYASWFVNF